MDFTALALVLCGAALDFTALALVLCGAALDFTVATVVFLGAALDFTVATWVIFGWGMERSSVMVAGVLRAGLADPRRRRAVQISPDEDPGGRGQSGKFMRPAGIDTGRSEAFRRGTSQGGVRIGWAVEYGNG